MDHCMPGIISTLSPNGQDISTVQKLLGVTKLILKSHLYLLRATSSPNSASVRIQLGNRSIIGNFNIKNY